MVLLTPAGGYGVGALCSTAALTSSIASMKR